MTRDAGAAQKAPRKRHVCYNCAVRVSVWQSEKTYSIAKNLLDASRRDSSFGQRFCDDCARQGFVRRPSKEAVRQLKQACLLYQNLLDFSQSTLSLRSHSTLITLQGQGNWGPDTASQQQASLMATFFAEILIVNAVSYSAMY